jgi:hypothetical protein
MKYLICLFFFFITSLSGITQSRKDIKNDAIEARDTKNDIFIELNDGKILKYGVLKIKFPIMAYEYLEADGKKLDIPADSIKAFQTDKFYALRIFTTQTNLIGKLPFTELFAQRLRNGKIEMYIISQMRNNAYGPSGSSSSSGYRWSYYIKKGKNSDVIALSKENLKSMIQDNKGLLEEFDSKYKKSRAYDSATEIIDEYN